MLSKMCRASSSIAAAGVQKSEQFKLNLISRTVSFINSLKFVILPHGRSSLTMKDVKLHHHSQLQYGPVRHEDLELQLFHFIFHMLFSTSTSSSWKKEISPTGASKVTCRAPPTRPQAARCVMPACHQP